MYIYNAKLQQWDQLIHQNQVCKSQIVSSVRCQVRIWDQDGGDYMVLKWNGIVLATVVGWYRSGSRMGNRTWDIRDLLLEWEVEVSNWEDNHTCRSLHCSENHGVLYKEITCILMDITNWGMRSWQMKKSDSCLVKVLCLNKFWLP